jgi:excisionase family DNA binding protein
MKSGDNDQIQPLFWRLSEAALLLRMSNASIYEAVRSGQIPGIRIAGKWRIPRIVVDKFIADAMNGTASEVSPE